MIRAEYEFNSGYNEGFGDGYSKALNDFVEKAITMIDAYDGLLLDKRAIEHIRAELKAGVEDD